MTHHPKTCGPCDDCQQFAEEYGRGTAGTVIAPSRTTGLHPTDISYARPEQRRVDRRPAPAEAYTARTARNARHRAEAEKSAQT